MPLGKTHRLCLPGVQEPLTPGLQPLLCASGRFLQSCLEVSADTQGSVERVWSCLHPQKVKLKRSLPACLLACSRKVTLQPVQQAPFSGTGPGEGFLYKGLAVETNASMLLFMGSSSWGKKWVERGFRVQAGERSGWREGAGVGEVMGSGFPSCWIRCVLH